MRIATISCLPQIYLEGTLKGDVSVRVKGYIAELNCL